MIPEGSPRYNDLIDVVTQSATTNYEVLNKDGTVSLDQRINEDILWFKTGRVDSPKNGRFALELKEWERQAKVAFRCMCSERAKQYEEEIFGIGESYRRALDAEGSSSRRDKNNAKATLLDIIGRNRTEKIYTLKNDLKKGMWESITGKKTKNEIEEE